MPDVAREIIQRRKLAGLSARPSPPEFAQSLLEANIRQYDSIRDDGSVSFIDFSLVESLLMMREDGLLTDPEIAGHLRLRPYRAQVFFHPPWEAIFVQDDERDQTFRDSERISNSIRRGYEDLGFTLVMLPLADPEARADLILASVFSCLPPDRSSS